MACEIEQGRRPGPTVRAPREVRPELRREVAGLFGSVLHHTVEWLSPSGALVRSATACGLATNGIGRELLTAAEWRRLRGGEAPRVLDRAPCVGCRVRPVGRRRQGGKRAG